MFIFGLVLTIFSLIFIFFEYKIISYGEKVTARVVGITSSSNSNKSSAVLEYTYDNSLITKDPSYLFNTYRVGDELSLFVYRGNISIPALNNGYWIALLISLICGVLLLSRGLRWILRHRQVLAHKIVYLKRHGKKVHARYLRTEESAQTKNGHQGKILVLQQEGGEHTFLSNPIFSEYSVRWLHEHIFDVYVHPKKPNIYYIDLEKHYGQDI